MKLSLHHVRRAARERGWSLSRLLREAGVSRTAFYSLARKETVLPRSVERLGRALGVEPGDLLERVPERISVARRIVESRPGTAFDNVWHTLILLELPPRERLERSLLRGRAVHFHR